MCVVIYMCFDTMACYIYACRVDLDACNIIKGNNNLNHLLSLYIIWLVCFSSFKYS